MPVRVFTWLLLAGMLCPLLPAVLHAEAIDPNLLQWSIASLIDQSREPYNEPLPTNMPGQFFSPRDTRGLAYYKDATGHEYLYAGYNNSIVFENNLPVLDRNGEVRRIDLSKQGVDKYDTQWSANRVLGNRGKAIAVDDQGRVYMADANRIDVYRADLSGSPLWTINGPAGGALEGVAVTREAGLGLVVYYSNRNAGTLTKLTLAESGINITGQTPVAGFGNASGVKTLNGASAASSVRNVEIDASGNVWVAAKGTNLLYRVTASGANNGQATITAPFDVGFNGDQIFVTHQNQRLVSYFDLSKFTSNTIPAIGTIGSTILPDWAGLKLDSNGNEETGDPGLISGLVVIPGVGFYLGNENGQTFGQKSTYGLPDAYTANGFIDDQYDDNDPILFAGLPQVPEPGAILLASMALLGFCGYVRQEKRRVA